MSAGHIKPKSKHDIVSNYFMLLNTPSRGKYRHTLVQTTTVWGKYYFSYTSKGPIYKRHVFSDLLIKIFIL